MLFKLKDLLLCLSFCIIIQISQSVYRKVIPNIDEEAKCLDGSPGSFYMHEGIEKDKILLYFMGGGNCGKQTLEQTLKSCYERSQTDLGSSLQLPDILSGAEGILSLNETVFTNWTKIIFNYCDGSMHQGSNQHPVQYNGKKLYFRGSTIVRSHLAWLIDNIQLNKASKLVISGGSAGAAASILWNNYIISLMDNPSAVYNIPDAGVSILTNTFKKNQSYIQTAFSNLMKFAYATQKIPIQECNQKYPQQQWKCIFSEHNQEFLKGKFLFIDSQYDLWGIRDILGVKCLNQSLQGHTLKNCSLQQLKSIEDYRQKYITYVNTKLRRQNRAVWSIACAHHMYLVYDNFYHSIYQSVPEIHGLTVKQAVQKFVLKDQFNWSIDEVTWPLNKPCAY